MTDSKPLTASERSLIQALSQAGAAHTPVSIHAIAPSKRVGNTWRMCLRSLKARGYVLPVATGNGGTQRGMLWVLKRDVDGRRIEAPPHAQARTEIRDGVTVTICPPAYAFGALYWGQHPQSKRGAG